MNLNDVDAGWLSVIEPYLSSEKGLRLQHFLAEQMAAGETLLPPSDQWFEALRMTALEQVRVVILGQDPYHGPGQAEGLAFSVPPDRPQPPSLRNIFLALQRDLGGDLPAQGCLRHWASQGVLLLNSLLTVNLGQPLAHQNHGWEGLTDQLIAAVNAQQPAVVFMLWGKDAQKKAKLIDPSRHLVLKAPHPSPLSAYRGFLDCRHFSLANAFLARHQIPEIDWLARV